MAIIQYEHDFHVKKVLVSVQEHLKGRHREHCLCWQNCQFFKPNLLENCEIAQANYELCVEYNIVTPVFECPKFTKNK